MAALGWLYAGLSEAGDWDGIAQLIATDPDRERAERQRLTRAKEAAAAGACSAARELVAEEIDEIDTTAVRDLSLARILARCGDVATARVLATAYLEQASLDEGLLLADLSDLLDAEELTTIVRWRIAAAPEDAEILESLDFYLATMGPPDQR